MITLPGGFLVVLFIMYFATHGVEISHFLNFHSFVIVIVGSIAALLLSSPKNSIVVLTKSVMSLFGKDKPKEEIHKRLMSLIDNRLAKGDDKDHGLIKYAQDLWEQGVDAYLFEELLEQRLDEIKVGSEEPVTLLRNLAKYPPALGMMGTVMGMVSLFANLNGDNKDGVGGDLALAMTATFYGLILANLLFTPLSDRLHVQHLADQKVNDMVFNMLIFINRNEPATIIESIDGEYEKRAG